MAGSKWWVVLALIFSVGVVSMETAEAKRKKNEEEVPTASKSGREEPKDAVLSSRENQELLMLAIEQMESDQPDAAMATLTELAGQKKVNAYEQAKVLQLKAQIASDDDDYGQAIGYLEQAIAADAMSNSEHFQSMLILSQLYAQSENSEKSIEWFDRWTLDAESVIGAYWVMQAQNYYNIENYEKAVEYVDRAFATGDTPDAAWGQVKAASLYELERYDDAASFAKEQKMANIDNPDMRYQFMNLEVSAYLEQEKYDRALAVLEEGKAQGWFDRPLQWTQLYQLYFEDEQAENAAKVIEEGLSVGALDADAKIYVSLGEAYAVQDGKASEAVAAFDKASALSPNDGTADFQKGQMLLDMDRPEDAKVALTTAIEKGKLRMEGNAWYLLCVAENDVDRVSAAIAACRKSATFPESQSNAQNALRMMGAN